MWTELGSTGWDVHVGEALQLPRTKSRWGEKMMGCRPDVPLVFSMQALLMSGVGPLFMANKTLPHLYTGHTVPFFFLAILLLMDFLILSFLFLVIDV